MNYLQFRSRMMKNLFPILIILLLNSTFYAQTNVLPFECVRALENKFPTFRYDNDWDYEKLNAGSSSYSADWNGDGRLDYGIFIEFAGQKKLVLFFSSENGYKLVALERDAVLAFNQSQAESVRAYKSHMDKKYFENLPKDFAVPKDEFGLKILKEYGALFVAKKDTVVPKSVIFKNHMDVAAFQNGLTVSRETIGRFEIELQSVAMNALRNAVAEAEKLNLTITTRDYDAGRRSYGETIGLWYSRVTPALEYWTASGRIPMSHAERLKSAPLTQQIPEIFKLEEQGIFFSKDLSKSIMYSVAPPGTSQHLSMLAIDINEYDNPTIQFLMAQNGWHQTVISDLPHFTYLGASEPELPALGLKKVVSGGRFYWVPNL